MREFEMDEDINCPHCLSPQEDSILPYSIATDKAIGRNRSEVICEDCHKAFFVQPVEVTRYNTWSGRAEFYS